MKEIEHAWVEFDVGSEETIDEFNRKFPDENIELHAITNDRYFGIRISGNPEKWVPKVLDFLRDIGQKVTFVPVVYERYTVSHTLIRSSERFEFSVYLQLARLTEQLEVELHPQSAIFPNLSTAKFESDIPQLVSAIEAEAFRQAIPDSEKNLGRIFSWMETPPFNFDPWDFDVQWNAGVYKGSKKGISRWVQTSPEYSEAKHIFDSFESLSYEPEAMLPILKRLDDGENRNRCVLCHIAELLRNRMDVAQEILQDHTGVMLKDTLHELRGLQNSGKNEFATILTRIAVNLFELLQEPDSVSLDGAGFIFSEDAETKQSAIEKIASLYNSTYQRKIKDVSTRGVFMGFYMAVCGYLFAAGYISDAIHASLIAKLG